MWDTGKGKFTGRKVRELWLGEVHGGFFEQAVYGGS